VETIEGTIEKYLFFNENNGYSVLRLKEGDIIVGTFPKMEQGASVSFVGEWIEHKTYGWQFKAEKAKVKKPTTKNEILRYLSGGVLKGINKKLAKRIVDKFGEETIEVLNNSPYKLLLINGIGRKKLEQIIKSWQEHFYAHQVMFYLNKCGITGKRAVNIIKQYGNETIEIIEENPYRLVFDIEGIGFKIADSIANKIGFGETHPYRIKAWVIYYLYEASNKGNVFLPEEELFNACKYKINFLLEEDPSILHELEEEELIVRNGNKIYLKEHYLAEKKVERFIKKIVSSDRGFVNVGDDVVQKWKDVFSQKQFEAIESAIKNNITIITGGPGTGKTTTIKGIIDIYRDNKKTILLAAPTGRAAQRMKELIGLEAKTIHRLLEFNPATYSFFYNEENKLNADLIIVDEVSMIDIFLFYRLLAAIKLGTTLVLVGDSNQLPSVGPGNVLKDLIDSNLIPVVELDKIFRQAQSSGIIRLAHAINSGRRFAFENKPDGDVWFIEVNNHSNIGNTIVELVKNRLPQKFGYDPVKDIQVLSPMYRGEAGVDDLNKKLQKELNTNAEPNLNLKFKVGDKVMQLRNDYQKNIFNGDIGFVREINELGKKIKVYYDFKVVEYKFDELEDITLAYAITVHKSQGGEYPCVVMPIKISHKIMLRRKLIYTAVTRAKETLVLLGSLEAFYSGVANTSEEKRFSALLKTEG